MQSDGTSAGLLKPGNQSQQGGLPTTGGSQQPHQLTTLQAEIDPLQRPIGAEAP